MIIRVLAVGTRMPGWVQEGVDEYVKRFGPQLKFELKEIALGQRSAGKDAARAMEEEGRRMMSAIKDGSFVVALDVKGKSFSTEQLSQWLGGRLQSGQDLTLLIGGPDGIAAECLQRSDLRWSLSALTLPHPLVRIVLVEQLYRAHSLLRGHPYHRA